MVTFSSEAHVCAFHWQDPPAVAVDGYRATVPVDFERRGMRWPKRRATPACVEVWTDRRKRTRTGAREAELDAVWAGHAAERVISRADKLARLIS